MKKKRRHGKQGVFDQIMMYFDWVLDLLPYVPRLAARLVRGIFP